MIATSGPVSSADLTGSDRILVEALNCGRRHLVLNLHEVGGSKSEALGWLGSPWDPSCAGRRAGRSGGPGRRSTQRSVKRIVRPRPPVGMRPELQEVGNGSTR